VKAFVTGVTGFVGVHLAEHLLAQGDEVCGCSRSARWPDDTPDAVRDRVRLVAWNVSSPAEPHAEVRDELARFAPEIIYHLAALSVPRLCGESEPTPEALAANVAGTERVLDLAASLPSSPRVLFTSTSHVYAPVEDGSARLAESSPLGPRRGYGHTKLLAEEAVARAVASSVVDAVVARAYQHTGPRQRPPLMLPEWAEQFSRASSEPVHVHNLDTDVDLSDVRDVVRAYRLLVEHGSRGEAYNVGSGVGRRTGDIFEILRNLADPDHRREIVERRPGRRQDPIANVDRLVACTGWSPRFTIHQTVADTLAYWRNRAGARGDAS